MHRIEADLLIPGRGEPVSDGVVVLDGDRIGYAGPARRAGDAARRAGTGPLPSCPGCGTATGTSSARARSTSAGCRWSRSRCGRRGAPATCGPRCDAGVTSVREVGGLGRGPGARGRRGGAGRAGHLRGRGDPVAPPAATATCTPTRWPGSRTSARTGGDLRLADGRGRVHAGGARAAAPRRPADQGVRLRRRAVRAGRPDPPAVHGGRTAGHRRGRRPWPNGRSPRTATASRASWPRCRRGCARSSTAPTSTTSACDAMRETGAILVPTRTIIEDMLAEQRGVPGYAVAKLTALRGRARRGGGARRGARRHHRGGHRHRADRHGPAQLLGHNGAELAHLVDARHDAAAGDRGGDRDRAGHARPAGAAGRAGSRRATTPT